MDTIETFYFRYLRYIQAKNDATATSYDKHMALCFAVRSLMVDKWIETQKRYHDTNPRRVYFLSMEYVFGKSLRQNIINLGLEKSASDAAEDLGFSLEELYEQEEDSDLGNAGRGRLAACFQDSMATMDIPAIGYGLRYDYGIFQQQIKEGRQIERPYDWLHKGHPWEIKRPEYSCTVGFYGTLQTAANRIVWKPSDNVIAMPYDFPIPGYKTNTVNTLRLWASQASEKFLEDYINHGDYIRACEEKFQTSRITNYLIPDEDVHRATEMRIKQQYFFTAASLHDIVRRYKIHNPNILDIDKKVVMQLNESKCAIAIVEFMRILLDEEQLPWNDAWRITRRVFAYTSHSVSPDSQEKWPVYLIENIIPRHLQIIYDINQWHLDTLRSTGRFNLAQIRELSIIEEGEVKWVKMAHLVLLGSFSVNGVSQKQTELLGNKVFATLKNALTLEIKNITNGIALRRWLLCANKPLASLITELIGDSWITHYREVEKLEQFAGDSETLARLDDIKHAAKRHLQAALKASKGIEIDPDTFFDVDCKKIHPYKRQVLHILYILLKYLRIKEGEEAEVFRTHIFSGKASPSDFLAKQIILLIHMVARVIANDPVAKNKLTVVFIPNYNVSMAENVIPAADLSEQISAVNNEASGTSNMKFAINGAMTIASQTGSNIEMIERVGAENIIVFGHSGREIDNMSSYNPVETIESNEELRKIFGFLETVLPSLPGGTMISPLVASLKYSDPYYVLLDYDDYVKKQRAIDTLYTDRERWLSMAFRNIARSGWFSSDRAIEEYAREIWGIYKK